MKLNKTTFLFYLSSLFAIFLLIFFCPSFTYASTTKNDAWFLHDIHAQTAWNTLIKSQTDTNDPVIVAVIDTGCDYSHPLIQNALWTNTAELNGIPGQDDDQNGYTDDVHGINTYDANSDPMDDSVGEIKGHGTHVAGCILQTAGVTETSNPFHIQIMPIKAGDSYGNFRAADVAEALHYAADNHASVINLSISSNKFPAVLQEALEYASQSAILVASAGNRGLSTSDSLYASSSDFYPAACPYVTGVMSYGKTRILSSFSNWDFSSGLIPKYDLAAPGEAISSCTYQNSYQTMNGTSMSAGIVSGCAALLTAKYQSAGTYCAKDLAAHLMESGNFDIPFTDLYGKNHTFRSIHFDRLLSELPKPNLILSEYAVEKKSSDREYELHYSISNRGSLAKNVIVDISSNIPEITLLKDHQIIPTESPALSSHNGNCFISVPQNNSLTSILLNIRISYENGANPSDTNIYTKEFSIPIPSDNNISDSDTQIPLQGITISASSKLALKARSSMKLAVSYIPENTTDDKTLTFQSSRPLIADIEKDGTIHAKKSGTATITVTSSKNHIRRLTVFVYEETPDTPDDSSHSNPILTIPEAAPEASIQKGGIYIVDGMKYKITNAAANSRKTVTLLSTTQKKASLSSLTIKDTIQIGNAQFRITAIAKKAFFQCKNLKKVKIGNCVQTIGSRAFSKCTSLKSISIGTKTSKISARAFAGCRKLRKIRIKSKNVKIGKHAFSNIHPKVKVHGPKTFLTQWSKYQQTP